MRIKIVAWQPQTEIYEWNAINGEYTVDVSGKISVPLIGEVEAAGLTTVEVADRLATQLQQRTNTAKKPNASVEIVRYRPFYIVGDVANSGEYPYRPGMTVIQAMTIAGGLPRSHAIDIRQIERDIVGWTGEAHELNSERLSLLAKKARLEAELNGSDAIAFPDELKNGSDKAADAMAAQTMIFKARRDSLKISVAAQEQLKSYLATEIDSLKAQLEQQNRLLTIAQEDKQRVDARQKTGLVTEQRYLAAQRDAPLAQNELLQLQDRLKASIQDVAKATSTLLQIRSDFRQEAIKDLNDAKERLQQVTYRIATDRNLVMQSSKIAPLMVDAKLGFSIIRPTVSGFTEVPATETTLVSPGDTIKVKCCGSAAFDDSGLLARAQPSEGETAQK